MASIWTVAALSAPLLALGCGPAREDSIPPAREAAAEASGNRDEDGVRLALLEPSADSDAAALEGVLQVRGRCLYLTQPGASGATLLAFSIPGARWDGERGVLVAHDRAFAPGQRVRLGGSSVSNPSLLRWVQPPDPSCDARGMMVVGGIDPLPEPTP